MSSELMRAEVPADESGFRDYDEYRVLSKAALFSLVMGFVSLLAMIDMGLLVLPLVGLILGLIGLVTIKRRPMEYSGRSLAIIGCVLCVAWLAGAGGYHRYVYSTEVPDGFERVSFYELLSDPQSPDSPIPPRALELNGKSIFLKGYVHPSVQSLGPVREFLLVPDMKSCCFGGPPKLTHKIAVSLSKGDKIEYSLRKRKLAGVLHVNPNISNPIEEACYTFDVEYVK